MYFLSHVTAIILAAGKGNRFGGDTPKQFQKINGKEMVELAISKFEENDKVDYIILVLDEKDPNFDEMSAKYITELSKIRTVVPGGKERQDSVRNGLKYALNGIVLIHDSARPFVTNEVIDRVIIEASKSGSAVPCVDPKDTIRTGETTLNRNELHLVQTPQGFKLDLLKDAYDKAYMEGFYGTDDASIFERFNSPCSIVEGDYENIKITTKDDMKEERTFSYRVGNGFDVHKLVPDRKLVLGGVEIPYELGLLGHSDADVALHALMDSLLGAAGLGDIGRHFPDTDDEYLGISSLELLKRTKDMLVKRGFEISNVDITIICEKPRISMYTDDMIERIAGTLEIHKDQVNVKGTTTEKLGFTGRGEGIASLATSLVIKKEG